MNYLHVAIAVISLLSSAFGHSQLSVAQESATPVAQTEGRRLLIAVRGASGTADYGRMFDEWTGRWVDAGKRGGADVVRIGATEDAPQRTDDSTDFAELREVVSQFAADNGTSATSELWIVLNGHGTFDGRASRFNLRGPDVSARDFADWLETIRCPVVVANCASSSGTFVKELSGPDRIVITATKNGAEQNFARFGDYLSQAIGDAAFDLDKDGQTSLFEAYLSASRRTEEFYKSDGRLATEHSLLDDNGDSKGVRSDWFRGLRLVKKSDDGTKIDGRRSHQLHLVRSPSDDKVPPEVRRRRDKLELQIVELRDRRPQFPNEDAYYTELEPLLVTLAELYEDPGTRNSKTSAR